MNNSYVQWSLKKFYECLCVHTHTSWDHSPSVHYSIRWSWKINCSQRWVTWEAEENILTLSVFLFVVRTKAHLKWESSLNLFRQQPIAIGTSLYVSQHHSPHLPCSFLKFFHCKKMKKWSFVMAHSMIAIIYGVMLPSAGRHGTGTLSIKDTESRPERTELPFCHTTATVQAHHTILALLGISVASISY